MQKVNSKQEGLKTARDTSSQNKDFINKNKKMVKEMSAGSRQRKHRKNNQSQTNLGVANKSRVQNQNAINFLKN